MTVNSTTSRVAYSGNGITTVFAFPYYFLADTDLVIIQKDNLTGVETTKVLTTDYTVSGAGIASGGAVTMLTSPPTGKTLSIYRDPLATQDLHLVENDELPAAPIEKRFDKLTMLVQRLVDRMSRGMRLTDGYAAAFDTRLPAILPPGQMFTTNQTGDGIVMTPIPALLGSVPTYASDAAFVAGNGPAVAGNAYWNTSSLTLRIFNGSIWRSLDTPTITGTLAGPVNISAAVAITVIGAQEEIQFIQGNGAPVVMTANPQIAPGTRVGDKLRLVVASAQSVELQNGNGLSINGPWVGSQDDSIDLWWRGSDWAEVARK